jgi:hypothetical protein
VSCRLVGTAIVCGSWGNPNRLRYMHCPTCKTRRRMSEHWDGAWYGSTLSCMSCGEMWQDGVRGYRPFQRGWRQERVRALRGREHVTASAYRAFVQADVAQYVGGSR